MEQRIYNVRAMTLWTATWAGRSGWRTLPRPVSVGSRRILFSRKHSAVTPGLREPLMRLQAVRDATVRTMAEADYPRAEKQAAAVQRTGFRLACKRLCWFLRPPFSRTRQPPCFTSFLRIQARSPASWSLVAARDSDMDSTRCRMGALDSHTGGICDAPHRAPPIAPTSTGQYSASPANCTDHARGVSKSALLPTKKTAALSTSGAEPPGLRGGSVLSPSAS